MPFVTVRCYAELNEFLPQNRRFVAFNLPIQKNAVVEDITKEIKIPSSLIDLILVNNKPVGLLHCLKENDRAAFFPVFETFDISAVTKIRNNSLRQSKFVLDVHLGKLANHLRLFGFDALYQNDFTSKVLLEISTSENRILLSGSRTLLETESLTHSHFVRNKDPRLQLIEVFEWFDLYSSASPFTRCIKCNALLHSVEKETILDQIPQKVREWCQSYQQCGTCKRIYWEGSHYHKLNNFVQEMLTRKCSNNQSIGKD